jgi:hypothetical protein
LERGSVPSFFSLYRYKTGPDEKTPLLFTFSPESWLKGSSR